jgi:hypothetical protein
VGCAVNHDLSPALFEAKEQVMPGMGFRADLLTGISAMRTSCRV